MAYAKANLQRIDGTPGAALYIYKTADLETAIDDSGYFDDAVDDYNLDTGDIIMAVYDTGGTIGVKTYVATNTSGTVTVTDEA